MRASRSVTQSGGSVLKAPQRRRGGTPPRAEPGAYRYPKPCIPCILGHERPRVARPRSTGYGHAKRGLRPQGAPAPQRGHSPASGTRRVPLSQAVHPVHPRARKTPRSVNAKRRRRLVTRSCARTPTRASRTSDAKTPCLLLTRGRGHGVIS